MKKIILLALALLSYSVVAETLVYRPVGTFTYNNQVILTKKRTAETSSHTTVAGKERIKELKKIGFTCIRKNQEVSICQKTETNLETPDYIQKAVDDYLKMAKFTFSGTGEPTIVHDGASTEWMVYEDVFLGSKKISLYKIVKTFEGRWFLSFPVSEDQGIGNMYVTSNEQLELPLTMQGTVDGQTVGYFITATFIK